MAIFGFGATYNNEDVHEAFVEAGVACVGWTRDEAPPLHNLLRHIKAGDIAYLKSFSPNIGLTIKAVGVVLEGTAQEYGELGWGVTVRWTWQGEERIGRLEDKYPVRTITLYEEYNPEIQQRVIDLLLST